MSRRISHGGAGSQRAAVQPFGRSRVSRGPASLPLQSDETAPESSNSDLAALVDGCLKKCKPEARANIYGVAASLYKDLTNMEKSHQRLKKHKLIRDTFKDRKMPSGVTPYKDSFQTIANEGRAEDAMGEEGIWQFWYGDFNFTVATTGQTTLSEFEGAVHFMKIAAHSTIDVAIARKNISGLLGDCSHTEFEQKCLRALKSEFVAAETPEDPDDISPLQRLDIGPANVFTHKQEEVELLSILEIYRRTVEKARNDVEKQLKSAKSTRMKKRETRHKPLRRSSSQADQRNGAEGARRQRRQERWERQGKSLQR